MIEQAFEVATEFRFDIGQALLNTDTLKGAVDDLSKSATGALTSLHYLASGLVAHLGFGSGGLLSVLTKAVQISEEFNQNSLGFANNISSNMMVLSGTIATFNDRLETSKMLMGDISNNAIKFGLDTTSLARMTQLIATPLAMRGKLGTNYGNAISMSRNLMLGSEAVGLHPDVAAESLYRALTDRMPLHGKLFARLANTPAFKAAHVMSQQQIMNMNPDKKIDLLAKSLQQLGGDADWLKSRLSNIGVQFTILRDQIAVILKPIGDAIIKPIKILLKGVNDYILAHGKEIGDNLGKLIGNIFEDPKALFINVMQLKNLGKDFRAALHLTELVQIFLFLKWGLGLLGITLNGGLLRRGLTFLIEGLQAVAMWIWRTGVIGYVFRLIGTAVAEVLPMFLVFLGLFQTLSRARAIAHANDVVALTTLAPRLSAVMLRIKTALENILLPFTMVMNAVAEFIAPLFQTSTWARIGVVVLEKVALVMEFLGKVSILALAGFQGLVFAIAGFVQDLVNFKGPFAGLGKNFNAGVDQFLKDNEARIKAGGSSTSKSVVTNNNHINARFDMREQLEPDRIAFSVMTHLKKLAINPTQGSGQSHSGAFANAAIAGAR